MAYKVFGNPITEETLKGMPEYANKSIITHVDKARMAFNMNSTVEAQVCEYMENLQKKLPCDIVSTFGTIYNATGDIVKSYAYRDYPGKSADESVYPVTIRNGQCGVFLHGETKEMGTEKCNGSCGAVVYLGRNNNEEVCEWMMSWSNSISVDDLDNKVSKFSSMR
ncbi:jasmonate-induced protein homolog [Camellia sinensis]|uniref:jasmonate-induced protein homolog n=1 Tax=Camellia sinensis TaxID=4442 RepID=UPI001035790B|nr:jasmonate-induced protein homolog [Camellia sinensis]